jgi:hypothetical protein
VHAALAGCSGRLIVYTEWCRCSVPVRHADPPAYTKLVLGAFSASLLHGTMVMCCPGFLTPYDVDDFENALSRVLGANEAPVFCTLRTRKCCEVFL